MARTSLLSTLLCIYAVVWRGVSQVSQAEESTEPPKAPQCQVYNCLIDPCQDAHCQADISGANCSANYCGGCNREWRDDSGNNVTLECEGMAEQEQEEQEF